ncbi:MAG: FMN-binding negative transcriptional regulator [Lewinellaceae bacterium]|nr:FMN-binding negative transcriptional regulator [Lewinellaceae bacterium]
MYAPKHYQQHDLTAIEQFIRNNPFGIIISATGLIPEASHIPMELEKDNSGNWILTGHLSKANGQNDLLQEEQQALAIFQGPHHYISSQWYNHANVPTWNFLAVHLGGRVRRQTAEETRAAIEKMMARYEPSGQSSTSMDQLPADLLDRLFRGVQGFVMQVETISGKWKLSQNRDDESARNVIDALEKLGNDNALGIAAEMKKLR